MVTHRISETVAAALREYAGGDHDETVLAVLDGGGVFLPITAEERTNGRASCRLCGNAIPKGARAIRFEFDPYASPDGGAAAWGKLAAAYLHETFCAPEKEG